VTCDAFARWLDDGAAASAADPHLAHAATCAACGTALAAARALDTLLAAAPAPGPAGFADRVMARVGAIDVRRIAAPQRPALPWWARAAAEPAAALALVVAAITLWGADRIARGGLELALVATRARWALPAWPSLDPAEPYVALGLGIAVLPFMMWAAWRLFAWSERAASFARPARPARR